RGEASGPAALFRRLSDSHRQRGDAKETRTKSPCHRSLLFAKAAVATRPAAAHLPTGAAVRLVGVGVHAISTAAGFVAVALAGAGAGTARAPTFGSADAAVKRVVLRIHAGTAATNPAARAGGRARAVITTLAIAARMAASATVARIGGQIGAGIAACRRLAAA